jgi:hypothetical protein
MKSFAIFLVCLLLAFASFGFARHHYVQTHTVTVTNPLRTSQKARLTDPLIDQNLFGNWVKDEWVFAIAVPAVLILGGLYAATRQ